MQLDRTFCQGERCGKATECERWIENLIKWAKGKNIELNRISIADFSHHLENGKCAWFCEKSASK